MDERHGEVLDFWFRELGPADWFDSGETLDPVVRRRFGALHAQAGRGALDGWAETPLGRLALILVLDQFSRHIHRGDARAFACDPAALRWAQDGIAAGMDERLAFSQRHFFTMPLMHSEDPAVQAASVERYAALRAMAAQILDFAHAHQDEIARFGRFPGRNAALGRASTDAEAAFLTRQAR